LFVEFFSAVLLLIAGAAARDAGIAGVLPARHIGPNRRAPMAVGTTFGQFMEPDDKLLQPRKFPV